MLGKPGGEKPEPPIFTIIDPNLPFERRVMKAVDSDLFEDITSEIASLPTDSSISKAKLLQTVDPFNQNRSFRLDFFEGVLATLEFYGIVYQREVGQYLMDPEVKIQIAERDAQKRRQMIREIKP